MVITPRAETTTERTVNEFEGGFLTNVAVTARPWLTVTLQLASPVHAPLQPPKCEPAAG
jgi:hypothetical protein